MPSPAATTSDSFTLTYWPDQHLLVGRWLRPVSLAEYRSTYETFLAAALAHNCRHWLLDLRRRRAADDEMLVWFGRDFAPRMTAAFQAPVYIAYFSMVSHEQAIVNPRFEDNVQQGRQMDAHYHYFITEGECLGWLLKQP